MCASQVLGLSILLSAALNKLVLSEATYGPLSALVIGIFSEFLTAVNFSSPVDHEATAKPSRRMPPVNAWDDWIDSRVASPSRAFLPITHGGQIT